LGDACGSQKYQSRAHTKSSGQDGTANPFFYS